ncbi:condensin complex protein MksE [Pseudomonas aeruginosa]
MSPIFSRVVNDLIKGAHICPYTDQEGYAFLESDVLISRGLTELNQPRMITNAEDVDEFLNRIGMRLTKTGGGIAYFAAYQNAEDSKKKARERFGELKNTIRPLISFLDLIMRATGDDGAITPGRKFDVNQIMARIASDEAYLDLLRKTAVETNLKSSDTTDRGRLLKIVGKFVKAELLEEVNQAAEIFQFTGRLEYALEAIEFLMEHDQIPDEDEQFNDRVPA